MVIRHVESNEDEVDVALELVKEKGWPGLFSWEGIFPIRMRSCVSSIFLLFFLPWAVRLTECIMIIIPLCRWMTRRKATV